MGDVIYGWPLIEVTSDLLGLLSHLSLAVARTEMQTMKRNYSSHEILFIFANTKYLGNIFHTCTKLNTKDWQNKAAKVRDKNLSKYSLV